MTILVVEEEQEARLLLQDTLEKAGYHVLLAEPVEIAKLILQETPVAAVIVSWTPSALGGHELAQWIHRQPSRMVRHPVVIAMGNISPVIDVPVPVDLFVPRPFNPTEILAFLKRLLSFEREQIYRMPESKTILVVDDEAHIRAFIHRHLAAEGYQVVEAENGEIAQKYLRELAIDAVFTDYWMPPGMDGPALVQWIRQQPEFASLPIIASSATSEDAESYRKIRQPFFDAGCDRFLVRPFNPQELIRWFKELLA